MNSNTASKVAMAAGVAAAAFFAYKLISERLSKAKASPVPAASAAPAPSAVGVESFPVVDLKAFLGGTDKAQIERDCKVIAEQLHKYGLLIVKDPRVDDKENDVFIDMMEKYFEQPAEATARDARPEVFYQVGVTPNGVERARDHCDKVAKMADSERPVTECPPGVDPKWRFFWRIGDRPKETKFPQMNSPEVVPAAFPQWPQVMNRWGGLILQTVFTVSKMAASGFGLPENTFHDMLQMGPHLLAPTGSDLAKFGTKGTVFASYHYDLNFMTIHGRSRFPGLYVWTREGKKVLVRVPPNCLLLQAGKQFEWITGGHVLAGFHEVVVCNETLGAIDRAKTNNKSLWRISSTLFSHVASDKELFPLAPFATEEAVVKYPKTFAGDQVQEELNAIKLARAM